MSVVTNQKIADALNKDDALTAELSEGIMSRFWGSNSFTASLMKPIATR